MSTLSHATLQLQPTKTTCPLPVLRVENPPPMLLSAATQVPVESSEPLSLKDAKAEDILKGLQAMSPEDRKKVEDALKIVEKDMMAKVARIYKCSSGNGDWGDYEMQVGWDLKWWFRRLIWKIFLQAWLIVRGHVCFRKGFFGQCTFLRMPNGSQEMPRVVENFQRPTSPTCSSSWQIKAFTPKTKWASTSYK